VSKAKGALRQRLDREHHGGQPPYVPAFYQRLFTAGVGGSVSFRVKKPVGARDSLWPEKDHEYIGSGDRELVADVVLNDLAALEASQLREDLAISTEVTHCQVSPWLERTRWLHYLEDIPLNEAAKLVRLPHRLDEPLLDELGMAIDRLVEAAHNSLCTEKVNFFGQRRISSFLPGKEVYSRPLVYKLQKSTYKQYKQSWKRALAFICRTHDPDQHLRFQHVLNSKQTALLDSLLAHSAARVTRPSVAFEPLDRVCLDFCLSLLEQPLRGNVFQSPIVGFLAVLGIDEANGTLYEAPNYTPKLSAFIKIAQLLVLQKAVMMAEDGLAQDPLDPLDEMRERLMTLNNTTPFTWALHMRSYGKQIRDSTTSLGYMRWSEDAQTIHYRDLELPITSFRQFVHEQVHKAQQQMETLFLLGRDEERAEVVPRVALHRIHDNPTVVTQGWNFTKDKRNKDTLPPGDTWLLRRVLQLDRLRDRFCSVRGSHGVEWDSREVQWYRSQVDSFLETLLLLVHMTAGQPARGTEITGLQHTNNLFHRNVFVEDGLVALVTSYHKGYTCTGTTKIIHRYLPREISELLVYYLWLILPFAQKVELLQSVQHTHEPTSAKAHQARGTGFVGATKSALSSLLWPEGKGMWSSSRLGKVLKRETSTQFNVPLTIPIYRHVAIAISRRHLSQGGFKRDYDIGESSSDQQTAHTSWTAGRLYARGLEEAPGHVEARRAGFRAVSRSWHAFLGFSDPTLGKKRPLQEMTNMRISKAARGSEGRGTESAANMTSDPVWEY
jgi:hypothetical protein